jgi:hypothetical protein
MSWMVFGMGVLVGMITGVVIVALCQMASMDRYRRVPQPEPQYGYEPLRSPWLVDETD